MPSVVRVAAIQAEALPGRIEHNIATAARLAAEAADRGARLIVTPEAFATGYDLTVFDEPLPGLQEQGWLAPLQQVADGGVTVVLNTALAQDGRRLLADVVLTAGRPATYAYAKQHLYPPERALFAAGDHGASLDLAGNRFALSVCYDANFPEHAAAAADDGAFAYVNSGAYFPGGEARRDLHYAARALDNGMYVVFAGLIGGPHDFVGGTAVYDPVGRPLVRLGSEEGVAVADLDPEAVAEARRSQRMWADRLADLGPRRVTHIRH